MGLSLQNLRDESRSIAGIDSDDDEGSNTKVDQKLNRSFWEVLNKFDFKQKERTSTFVTVAGEDRYQLTTDFEAVRSISIQDVDLLTWNLVDQSSIHTVDVDYDSNSDQEAAPAKYIRESNVIQFQPIPDQVYTIQVRHLIYLEDLSDSNSTVVIPREWHEIIMYGGAYRLLFAIGDVNRGDYYKRHFYNLMQSTVPQEAKEEKDTKFAGVDSRIARGSYISNYSSRLRY